MRRLFSLVKKVVPITPEQQEAIAVKLRKKVLLPRQRLGEAIPPKSWIFVEEGFLSLLHRESGAWVCGNFYHEGVSTCVFNTGAAELAEESFDIQAVEKSVIYYLTPGDEREVATAFPSFAGAQMILTARSHHQHRKRAQLFTLDHAYDRIINAEKFFTILFRAPERHLAEFLGVEDKICRKILASACKKQRASRHSE